MHEVYERYVDDVKLARETFAPIADQVGAVVYVAGDWAGLELLAAPGLFARVWRQISTGYVADALGPKATGTPRVACEEVIARVMAAPLEMAPAVGLGAEYRISGRHAIGAALVEDVVVAHLAAFPTLME